VVAHVAVSVDGATTGFAPDQRLFYELAGTWREDVTLVGADTILAQEPALATAPHPGPAADGPLLAVVDGRGRVREWAALREIGHWSDVLALHAVRTPPRPPDRPVRELVVGDERVDLAAALEHLGRSGAAVVRVDSGGALIAALLSAALLDELSLLVHPLLVPAAARWFGAGPCPFALLAAEPVGDGLVWVRYRPR
jgi:2,5-diamino-6-(ribosylamino)-4(3H)-pyrimidinone 5'-phosphate reductase